MSPLRSLFLALLALFAADFRAQAADVVVYGQAGPHIFQLAEPLGRGYSATTFAGRGPAGEPVAVKIHSDAWIAAGRPDKLAHEANVLSRVHHPTLPAFYGLGQVLINGRRRQALVMERAHGTALWDLAEPLPPRIAVRATMQVLRAARALHLAGYRHNDLHPGNIVMLPGRPDTLKVLDFGEAAPIERDHRMNNPVYGAPEQQRGSDRSVVVAVTPDIYSIGGGLAHLLTGRHPPEANRREIIEHIASEPLRRIASRAMDLEPTRRYQTAQAFIDDLRPFAQ